MKGTIAFALLFLCVAFVKAQDVECTICTVVIGAVEKDLANNGTQESVEKLLDRICTAVPGFKTACEAIVAKGVPQVIQWIIIHENATVVCELLGICKKVSFPASTECTVCTLVVGAVEKELANNATEADIIKLLDSICGDVPGFKTACDAIVANGVPTVISWIETHENATVVCGLLGLCPKVGKALSFAPRLFQNAIQSSAECQACQGGVGFIESWLAENATESMIAKALESTVCKLIPNIQSTCDAIAQTGITTVISWIKQYDNSTIVCQKLKVCTAIPLSNRLLSHLRPFIKV